MENLHDRDIAMRCTFWSILIEFLVFIVDNIALVGRIWNNPIQ